MLSKAIRTCVVKIGNSQGIQIPKPLLEQSGVGEEVEIEIQDGYLILRAASQARAGWEEAFAAMAENQDDALLDEAKTTAWDDQEWKWGKKLGQIDANTQKAVLETLAEMFAEISLFALLKYPMR